MLLLPKLAFEKNPGKWWDELHGDLFQTELQTSKKYFAAAGETGKTLLKQMDKVERRIDQNGDHVFADQEMSRYLSEKILYLVKY
jgi:hypothetical protein